RAAGSCRKSSSGDSARARPPRGRRVILTQHMAAETSDSITLAEPATPSREATISSTRSQPLIRPAPIVKGDTIGVVAPSYSPRVGWLTRGVKALERAGFPVLLDPEITTLRRF